MHNIPDFLRVTPEMQEHFAKGGMIKRADGSYSKRGLWDNIRANKGSGKKPTKEMLEQEAKIRAEEQYGGVVDQYGNGGYTVRRSHDRKGKTHVVIGPDGTKKYFGDPNMGERGKSKHGKEAFYARHAKNLKNNPYFRAYARATWKDGGEIPTYASGTSYADPSQLSQDQLTNWNRFQYYASKNANITDPAYNTNRQMGYDLLNQYNQANPNNQVPTDSIPTYQAYFQKLQAGQTNVGQAGQEYVQKNFTQGVSPQDAFIGTQTLGSRVPMRGKKTVTNANTGQVVYNSGARTSTALPTPAPSQPVAQTNTAPVPGMQTATLAYGGYYKDGGTYGPFYGRRDAAKLQRWRNPTADSMTPSFFAMGGLNKYQDAGETVVIDPYRTPTRTFVPPTANYPAMEMDMSRSEDRWANRKPIEGMQQAPLIMSTNVAPEIVETSNTPVQPAVVAQEPARPLSNVERMELMRTRGIPVPSAAAASRFNPIPVSTSPSYLQRTYESTEGIPKTVLHFFDTKKDIINSNDNLLDRVAELKTNIIFDAATKKAYEREYNPETGKFKIKSYKIRPSQLKEFTENPISYTASSRNQGIGYINDTINNPSPGCKTGECLISEDGTVFDAHALATLTDPEENHNTTRNFGNYKDNSFIDSPVDSSLNFITINSDKSFDENINLIKENEKKYSINNNLETVIPNMVKTMQQKLGRKLTEEEIKQVVSATTQRETERYNPNDVLVNHFANSIFYVPEAMYENPLIEAYNNGVAYSPTEEGVREYFRDNHKNKNVVDTKWMTAPSFEERLKNDPLGEYQYYLDEYKKFIENEQNKKFRNGGRTLGRYQNAGGVNYNAELAKWKQEHGQPTYSGNGYLATANYPDDAQFVYNAPAGTTFGRTVQAPVAAAPIANVAPAVTETPAPVYDVERMDSVPTRGLPIDQYTAGSIPSSLMKKDVIKPSTPLKTNDIPETVKKYFDTYTVPYAYYGVDKNQRETYDRDFYIIDKDTKKMYLKKFDPSYKGGFRIESYDVDDNLFKQIDAPGAFSSHGLGVDAKDPIEQSENILCRPGSRCSVVGNHYTIGENGKLILKTFNDLDRKKMFNPYNIDDPGKLLSNSAPTQETLVIESNKSFNDNEKSRKENDLKGQAFRQLKMLADREAMEKTKDDSDLALYHEELDKLYKDPELIKKAEELAKAIEQQDQFISKDYRFIGPTPDRYSNDWQRTFVSEEEKKRLYDEQQMLAEEQNKKRNGGRIYKRGGSMRRFDVGGENPFKNQLTSQNQFNSTYNPYATNIWGTQQQQTAPAQTTASNPFDNQVNNQNTVTTVGNPNIATIPQTANSGQGANTTTPAVNPATGPFATNIGQQTPGTQNLGQLGPAETAPKSAMAGLMERRNSIKSGLQQGYNNFKNSVAGNPATADNTKTATTPTSKDQPSLSQTIAQMNHGLNGTAVTSGDTAVVDQGLQDYFNSKDHQFLQGIDQVQSGLGRLARGITSINPNSQNAAVLGFDRRMNDTLTNRMTIAAPRKGIEYAKYGGKMSLKEGEELDLSTEQIHQLEKLGYKFQIL